MTNEEIKKELAENDNLRNLEIFQSEYTETETEFGETELDLNSGETKAWFYWFCLPGCLPDSDPMGPFKTDKEAAIDAIESSGSY
jgi:hypothetical protein